jgi:Cytochrome P460
MLAGVRLAPLAFALVATTLAACGGGDTAAEREDAPEARMTATAEGAGPPADTGTVEEPVMTEPGPTRPRAEPLPGLPRWTAGYRRWTKVNAKPLPPRDSDPHLGTKDVYASRPPRAGVYPVGTVIVKEAMRPGKDFVGLVAAMRKVAGANPDHNDWVFVEWTRDAEAETFTELARGGVCTSCHVGAADRDYVFTSG